jgi:hypothetical protein
MKPAVSMDADAANPTAITNYTEVGTDSDKAFLEEVLRIEGHWAHKR